VMPSASSRSFSMFSSTATAMISKSVYPSAWISCCSVCHPGSS